MMNLKTIDIDEITDSRELIEKKPPKFIIVFIYIFISIIIFSLIWSYFGKKEIVVKSQGIIKSDYSNIIKTSVNGEVKSIKVKEGQAVKPGDILIELEDKSTEDKYKIIKENISRLTRQVELLNKYEKSINSNTNLFNNNEAEKEFYFKYKNYENQIAQKNNDKDKENINLDSSKNDLNELQSELSGIESKISKLEDENRSLIKNKENVDTNNNSSEDEKNNNLSESSSEIENNKNEFSSIDSKILENKNEIEALNENAKNLKSNINKMKNTLDVSDKTLDNFSLDKNTIKNNEIINTEELIKEHDKEIKDLNIQLDEIKQELEKYTLKSKMDGVIHFVNKVNENDAILANSEIIKINQPKKENLVADIYISANDIAKIKEGQSVKVSSSSLPYREYGFLNGKITELDTDANIVKENNLSYYIAKVELNSSYLRNNKGEKSYLKYGMPIEGKIIVGKNSYLQLFLEKIDLWITGSSEKKTK